MKRRKERFRQFVERNRGAISALGALIVFATFLVKDRFEEKWKSEAEAIEFARAFYDIRADSASLLNSVQGITKFVLPQLLSAGDKRGADSQDLILAYRQTHTALRSEGMALATSKKSLDRVESLMRKFPHEKKDEETLKQIKAKSDQLISTNAADLGVVASAIGLLKLRDTFKAQGSNLNPDQANQLMLATANSQAAMQRANSPSEQHQLLNAENGLLQGVLAEAESAQKSNETLAVGAWWLSIALYTIGAAVTVIGQLYGVRVAEA